MIMEKEKIPRVWHSLKSAITVKTYGHNIYVIFPFGDKFGFKVYSFNWKIIYNSFDEGITFRQLADCQTYINFMKPNRKTI
jgi:hypothetical protein